MGRTGITIKGLVMEKLKVIFESELNSNRSGYQIPIFARELVTSHPEIYNYVLEQFKIAPLVPSFDLYLKSSRTKYDLDRLEQEHQEIKLQRPADGIARFYSDTPYEQAIKKLFGEYTELVLASILPSDCFVNDLHQTQFIIICRELERILDQLQELLFMEEYETALSSSAEYAELAMRTLIPINSNFIKKSLIDWLLDANTNTKMIIKGAVDQSYSDAQYKDDEKMWNRLKDKFNYVLSNLSCSITSDSALSENNQSTTKHQTGRKLRAKDYALTYILDLYATGKSIPTNRVDGGLAAGELKRIGEALSKDLKGDSFYRAVKELLNNWDLNSLADLKLISLDWYNVVKSLSNDWEATYRYLVAKRLTEGRER